jgi:hypothetical protein
MSFSQASVSDYDDSCLYFIAGAARNCSVPGNLTQLERLRTPFEILSASKSRAITIFGPSAQEAVREAFFHCSELVVQEAHHESNSMDT